MPTAEIDAIRQAVESGGGIEPHPLLNVVSGRVKWGLMAGIEGNLTRKKSLYRLILSVEMLGKAAAVEVDGLQVERLSGDRRSLHLLTPRQLYKRTEHRIDFEVRVVRFMSFVFAVPRLQ